MLSTVVEKQLPISDADKLKLITLRTQIFDTDVEGLAEKLFTGNVSIGQWEESMKRLIRELHASTAAISKGGWNEMTWSDWGRLGPVMKEQYKYLHGFAEYIEANKDTVSLRYIQARSKMYDNAANQTSTMMSADDTLLRKLPWIPGDLSTRCDGNCKCRWELTVLGKSGQFNVVKAIWRLSAAEHCETCVGRNGHEITFKLFETIEVPPIIGYMP